MSRAQHAIVTLSTADDIREVCEVTREGRRRLVGRIRVINEDTVTHRVLVEVRRAERDVIDQAEYERIMPHAAIAPGSAVESIGLTVVMHTGDVLQASTDAATVTRSPQIFVTWEDLVVPRDLAVTL